jgi:hypothetical protein
MKDRENHREVSVEQADEFRKKHKIALYIETSAKTGENVQTVFLLASKLLYMQNKDKIGEMVSDPGLTGVEREEPVQQVNAHEATREDSELRFLRLLRF